MKRFLVLVMILLPMLLTAQEPLSEIADGLNQISLNFEIAIKILKESSRYLDLELSNITLLAGQIARKSEEALGKSNQALVGLNLLWEKSEEAFDYLNQQTGSLETSFSAYKQEIMEKAEIAFGALERKIDTYQAILFGLGGGVLGYISGYNLNGPIGGLIGAGAGIGAGIVVALIF